jgi:hypothetical protein
MKIAGSRELGRRRSRCFFCGGSAPGTKEKDPEGCGDAGAVQVYSVTLPLPVTP